MKKIFAWIFSFVFALSLCGCSLFGDYTATIKENWEITIPKETGCTQVYEKQCEPSFHGDGFRYHVFACKDNQAMLDAFAWSSQEEKTNFHDSYSASCEEWLTEIDVPESERPVYAECVYYYKNQEDMSEIIMLFSETQGKLYVVESFL